MNTFDEPSPILGSLPLNQAKNKNNDIHSLRITIFQYERLTGYDTYIFDFIRVLTKAGHSVTVVTSDQMPLIGGIRILSEAELVYPLAGSRWIELKFLKFFPSLNSLHLLKHILASSNVVYVKNEILDLLPILMERRYIKTPIICGIHTAINYYDWKSLRAHLHNKVYNSYLYGKLLSACDFIHVLNIDDKIFLERVYNISPSKIYMIPLWVDSEAFHPLIHKEINHLFKILYLGSLDMRKGIDVLLESITRLSQEAPDKFSQMSFTIIGNGPLIDYVNEVQKKYNNIYYNSYVINRNDLYNKHDIVIVPSRGETFSYVTLEALSCGLPVIASDISGPKSVIVDQQTGVLFPVGDVPALVKAILLMYDLWNKGEEYCNLKKQCRQHILNNFSNNSIENLFTWTVYKR